jgi:hypothetical protein
VPETENKELCVFYGQEERNGKEKEGQGRGNIGRKKAKREL